MSIVGSGVHRFQRNSRHAEIGLSSAAVDDRACGEYRRAAVLEQANDLSGAPAGGDDVFNNDGVLAGCYFEASTQNHFVRSGVALGKKRTHLQSTRNLMADDNSAYRWRYDDIDASASGQRLNFVRQLAAKALGMLREGENLGALQILGAMQAAGEAEMTSQICAGFLEQTQDGIGRHSWKA